MYNFSQSNSGSRSERTAKLPATASTATMYAGARASDHSAGTAGARGSTKPRWSTSASTLGTAGIMATTVPHETTAVTNFSSPPSR